MTNGEHNNEEGRAATAAGPATPAVGGAGQIRRMAEVSLLSGDDLDSRKIIYQGTRNKQLLNTLRDVRTTLMQRVGRENFVTMVSSVCSGGGTTFFVVNLAACFALDPSKTALVIDCNLYEPGLDKLFGIDAGVGLTDHLEDPSIGIEEIIYATGAPRLRVIPVGNFRESGAEYFSSNRMANFINSVKERYPDRYIFLDVPPITNSAEARILVEHSDCAIMLVPYGKVSDSQVQAGVDVIGKNKLVGVVFNN